MVTLGSLPSISGVLGMHQLYRRRTQDQTLLLGQMVMATEDWQVDAWIWQVEDVAWHDRWWVEKVACEDMWDQIRLDRTRLGVQGAGPGA